MLTLKKHKYIESSIYTIDGPTRYSVTISYNHSFNGLFETKCKFFMARDTSSHGGFMAYGP